jgi:hypothetical protein
MQRGADATDFSGHLPLDNLSFADAKTATIAQY